jgi:hypothetical protein
MSARRLTEVAVILSGIDKLSKVVASAVGKSEASLKSFAKRANGYGESAFKWGKTAMTTGMVILAPLLMSINAAEEAAVAFNRLDQVYRSMGETTGQVAKEQAAWASAYQFEIGVEDEQIMLVQAKLATFSKVMSKEARDAGVMTRATQLAFDLQAAGFGDGAGNAVQLGKALNDPIKGLKALAKSGISFTAAEENKIKMLVASGRQLEAQNIILQAIEAQVGGVAKKTVTDSAKMKLALGEIAEQVGGALLPEVVKLTKYVTGTLLPGFLKWKENNEGLFSTIVKIVAVIGVAAVVAGSFAFVFGSIMKAVSTAAQVLRMFTYVTKLATAAQWLMNAAAAANPYVLITIAIIAMIAAIVAVMVYFDQLYNWFMKQSVGVKILVAALVYLFAPFLIFPIMIKLVIKHWDLLQDKFQQFLTWFRGWGKFILIPLAPFIALPLLIVAHWSRIRNFFVQLWSFVKGVFLLHVAIILAIPGMIRDRWNFMIAFYRNLWMNIKNIFTSFVSFVLSIPTKMYQAGMNMMNSLWEGIKSTVHKPIEAITNVTDQIRDYFPFSPAKRGALKDIHRVKIMETVAGAIKPNKVMAAMGKATGAIANNMKQQPTLNPLTSLVPVTNPRPNAGGGGAGMQMASVSAPISFNITVNSSGGDGSAIGEDIMAVIEKNAFKLEKIIQGIVANQQRKKL